MKRDDLENQLRLWGYYYGPRRAEAETGAGMYGNSTLAGLGRPTTIRQSTTMDRSGLTRRRLLGQAAGISGRDGEARAVPAWAVETVRGAETRSGSAKILAPDFSVPTEAQRVERSVLELHRIDAELALVMRAQYCSLGRQLEKAERTGIKIGVYREKLAEARGWVWARLAKAA